MNDMFTTSNICNRHCGNCQFTHCCIDVEKSMFYIKKFQKPINDTFRDVRLYTRTLQFDSALFDVYSCRFYGCLIALCNVTMSVCYFIQVCIFGKE